MSIPASTAVADASTAVTGATTAVTGATTADTAAAVTNAAPSGVVLTSGSIDLVIEAPTVHVTPSDDGSTIAIVTTAGTAAADGSVARAFAPPGTSVSVRSDGSADLRAADGSFVGGLAAPAVITGGTGQSVRYRSVEDGVIDLVVAVADTGVEFRIWLGTAPIASAEWTEREGGRSLAVVATSWARAGGEAATDGGWESLLALVPDADTAGMEHQFRCHAFGAPDKASWNLEPWRPDVGLIATLAAACNP